MSVEGASTSKGWIGLRKLPPESELRAVLVTLIVCLVCSAAIALTVSTLRPYREANRAREREARIQQMVASVPGLEAVLGRATGGELTAHVIDLESGRDVPALDPETFDALEAARDPDLSIALPHEQDIAGLGRRARYARVYTLSDDSGLRLVVLPVEGTGYISTLRGYLALDADLRTIRGLSFYEHGETPGLGSEIESPAWRALWPGKRAFDDSGQPSIVVVQGRVDPDSPDLAYRVDGITGATRTGDGVTRLLHFWLGPRGFGPYLERLGRSSQRATGETSG